MLTPKLCCILIGRIPYLKYFCFVDLPLFLFLESIDFSKPPTISLNGFNERPTDGWKSEFIPIPLLWRQVKTMDVFQQYFMNDTYALEDLIENATDADGVNVGQESWWNVNIGIFGVVL